MIAEQRKKSNIGVGVGFLVEVVGRVMVTMGQANHNTPEALFAGHHIPRGALHCLSGDVSNTAKGKANLPGWVFSAS